MPVIRFELGTSLSWRAIRDRETDYWVGVCDALKLTAQGETWQELHETIFEILNDLFLDLLNEGRLEAFLRERGWRPLMPIPQKVPPDKSVLFDVPFNVIQQAQHAVA